MCVCVMCFWRGRGGGGCHLGMLTNFDTQLSILFNMNIAQARAWLTCCSSVMWLS